MIAQRKSKSRSTFSTISNPIAGVFRLHVTSHIKKKRQTPLNGSLCYFINCWSSVINNETKVVLRSCWVKFCRNLIVFFYENKNFFNTCRSENCMYPPLLLTRVQRRIWALTVGIIFWWQHLVLKLLALPWKVFNI